LNFSQSYLLPPVIYYQRAVDSVAFCLPRPY